ncbi:M50 family metallopeptidase [Paenibacillus sp. UMB4589-SE434]|uniref:M50 family metallopeptidase n=1 Tax=Paenibacillus sp. UMB4589-SE434 TaxID=3046314 RepID=UPI00254DDF68|nr:M50 family metallopeptidase [Paenibacillus sp. UMB4589-SE434]MDK8182978.1 M50 family metallopeptidase [Paenibacillus sp. UMB4589-SE434]
MNRWWKTILFIVGAAVLTRFIPFSSFFKSVDTLIHEFGHALMTLLVSGKVWYIHLFADHSGVTYSSAAHAWQFIPIALAGYLTSALFAMLLFFLYSRGRTQVGLIVLTVLTAVCLLFFLRNSFGVTWGIGFILLSGAVCFAPWRWLQEFYYLLVAFICLVESVLSPLILVMLSVQSPSQAGDAANLARMTAIPALFWSLLFVLATIACARVSMSLFFKPRPVREQVRTSAWHQRN